MLVLLPPSETKSNGGTGAPLRLDSLSFGELNPTRRRLADALTELADDPDASLRALGLSERMAGEVKRNAALWSSPTAPALERYTGVLYDALEVDSMSAVERSRADSRLAVASALFGLVRGGDPVPAYRLSANSALPGVGGLRSVWRPALEPVLAAEAEPVVDLRSGAYAALARVRGAVEVNVVTELPDGSRKTVSHHNKAHKGRLARALASTPEEPEDLDDMVTVAEQAGIRVERAGERALRVIAG
ncbi:peroxide stress protein YaaA [Actinopolyspora xinjiangensis]|uniref:peroxide stress protein YaaA n=1 Tax=Actinopolyspora xinjiangensis TaxID=405564 RepID=UPI000ADB10FA|nr:peroxide stress protein YaaA [Actinopolyspora xinjiangensis]